MIIFVLDIAENIVGKGENAVFFFTNYVFNLFRNTCMFFLFNQVLLDFLPHNPDL